MLCNATCTQAVAYPPKNLIKVIFVMVINDWNNLLESVVSSQSINPSRKSLNKY